MSLFQKLFGTNKHDETACIRTLFDRTQPLHERGVAAEYLYEGQTPTAVAALLRFVLDETQDTGLREEAANTLGDIYSAVGIDHQALEQMPLNYREHVLTKASDKRA
jgi:hypothetical protein